MSQQQTLLQLKQYVEQHILGQPVLVDRLLIALLASTPVLASWTFDAPISVTPEANDRIFHHLESAGRRNIAVSGRTVAVTWEDDRDSNPSIYLARQSEGGKAFDREDRISGQGEAYEPGIIALANSSFESQVAFVGDEIGPDGAIPSRRLLFSSSF